MNKIHILLITSLLSLAACQQAAPDEIPVVKSLFTSIPEGYSGLDFNNQLEYDADFNIYTYRNFYNGGGVALGDINNDSLIDLYFSANMKGNRLYLNREATFGLRT
jgi:hypothetical protein